MAPGLQERGPDRVRRRVDLLEGGLGEGDPGLDSPRAAGGAGRHFEDLHLAGADALLRIGNLLPQAEHPRQHGQLLRVGQGAAGLRRGLPRADQRPGHVGGRIPVMGRLGGLPGPAVPAPVQR